MKKLNLRRRPDLEIYPQRRRCQKVWVIKDPVSLRYYQFREEEYRVFCGLDGRTSLEKIKQQFEERFAPRRITTARLHSFVSHLHRNGLVIVDAPGQGEVLRTRFDSQRRSALLQSFANPLAIRFRGMDPEPWLRRLYPLTRWVFTIWTALACFAIVMAAVMLLITRFESFQQRLPEWNALLSPGNLVALALVMAVVKLFHEIGHALTCTHYGGRCNELGLMLLVLTPCLYCNVTDAWKLSSRWQRVAIGAAGIVVEIVLASLCTILWFYSHEGLLNTILLNVMVVCSIGTVFLNGNPLLRYDGYYMLSDLLELPNLWQDSRRLLRRHVSKLLVGIDPGAPVSTQGGQITLLGYAIASTIYRVFVIASILYFVYRICKPEGLILLAQILTMALLIGLFSPPINAIWQIMKNPALRRRVRPRRLIATSALLVVIVAGGCLVPVPCRIVAPAVIEPHDARRVYISVPGRLNRTVTAGEFVRRGQTLAKLENIEISRELKHVESQLARQRMRVQHLESMRGDQVELAAQLPAAKEILADLQNRLAQLQGDEAALTLTAPIDGTVLPPPVLRQADSDAVQLASWSGTPLDDNHWGMVLERKTLYCLVGDPDAFEAAVYVDQSDVQYVDANQPVRLLLDIGGGRVINGKVVEISRVNLDRVPTELGFDQQIANRIDQQGVRRPAQTFYKAQIELDPTEVPLLIGARGQAKILVRWQPLGKQISRWFSRTFKPVI